MLHTKIISTQPVLHALLPGIYKKLHNAVLLSRTTIGNGVGIHLVVCPHMVRKECVRIVTNVVWRIMITSDCDTPGM